MKNVKQTWAWMLLVMLAAGAALQACSAQPIAAVMPQERIVLEGPGSRLPVQVEVATTEAEHERGLMFRRSLPPVQTGAEQVDSGMLFVWSKAQVAKFWMRNTLIPLDMLFFKDGELVYVVAAAQPLDETPVGPDTLVDMVLEVNAGVAARHGIVAGSAPAWKLVRAVHQ